MAGFSLRPPGKNWCAGERTCRQNDSNGCIHSKLFSPSKESHCQVDGISEPKPVQSLCIHECCAAAGGSGRLSGYVRGGVYPATQRRAADRSCLSMRCPRSIHPPRCLYPVSQERTFVAVKPDGVQVAAGADPVRARGSERPLSVRTTLHRQLLNSVAGTGCMSRQLTV